LPAAGRQALISEHGALLFRAPKSIGAQKFF